MVVGAWALAANAAGAAPVISGADTDVWNAAAPDPSYTAESATQGERLFWVLDGEDDERGTGISPLTIVLPDLDDGTYTLGVFERGDVADPAVRRFRVDRTPPRITVRTPSRGLEAAQGAPLAADYACTGAVRCEGPVPPGTPLDTSAPGTFAFLVSAVDDAGNESRVRVDYVVRVAQGSAAPPPAPVPAPPAPSAVTATRTAAPAPVTRPRAPAVTAPRTFQARRLRPRAGVRITTRRPLLRWTRRPGARLYNVQIFRLTGRTGVTKVLSAFPRANRYRVPRGRLAPGHRYIWRVWPHRGGRYDRRPLGVSHFTVRRR